MNASIKDSSHPSILFYDSDYPSRDFSKYPENFDHVVVQQGIANDLLKYQKLSQRHGPKVLELCCGTGRISMPLALGGSRVTAVDISSALLKRFKAKVDDFPDFPTKNLTILKQDVTRLDLADHDFDLVICAFNSLLCIPDFQQQQQTLINAANHLKPNGLLALDIWNPLVMNLQGDTTPEPYFTRKREDNGNAYTRFAATGPMGMDQVQSVFGWYDETLPDGTLKRIPYAMEWRVIFRYEIELMLEKAGFRIHDIYGGTADEVLETSSLKMFIEATKI